MSESDAGLALLGIAAAVFIGAVIFDELSKVTCQTCRCTHKKSDRACPNCGI